MNRFCPESRLHLLCRFQTFDLPSILPDARELGTSSGAVLMRTMRLVSPYLEHRALPHLILGLRVPKPLRVVIVEA